MSEIMCGKYIQIKFIPFQENLVYVINQDLRMLSLSSDG